MFLNYKFVTGSLVTVCPIVAFVALVLIKVANVAIANVATCEHVMRIHAIGHFIFRHNVFSRLSFDGARIIFQISHGWFRLANESGSIPTSKAEGIVRTDRSLDDGTEKLHGLSKTFGMLMFMPRFDLVSLLLVSPRLLFISIFQK